MISIKKEYNFNFSLIDNETKNLTGQSLKLYITFESVFDSMDNTHIEKWQINDFVQNSILEKINNAFICKKDNQDLFINQLTKLLIDNNKKILLLDFEPTVEKLCVYISKCLNFSCVVENKDFRITSIELFKDNSQIFSVKD